MVEILSNMFTRQIGIILSRVPEPLEAENLRTVVDLGTQSTCLDWHARMANNEFDKYIGEVLLVFGDRSFFTKLGLQTHRHAQMMDNYMDEKELTSLTLDLVRETIAQELQSMRILWNSECVQFES